MQTRDEEIRRLRQEDPKVWTYLKLSKIFRLSFERIRQICSYSDNKIIEKRTEIALHYSPYLEGLSSSALELEIKELSKQDRTRVNVMRRGILVAYLRKQGRSCSEIGRL